MTKPDRLTPRQQIAVQALASGETMVKAAVAASVDRKTIYRWLQQEPFTRAIVAAGDESLELLSRRLTVIGLQAINVLNDVLGNEHAPAGARIRAAEIVLARLLSVRELVDIERRLSELERANQ